MHCCKQKSRFRYKSSIPESCNWEPKLFEEAPLLIQIEDKLTKIDIKSTQRSNRENMATNSNFTSIKKNVEVELSKFCPRKKQKYYS